MKLPTTLKGRGFVVFGSESIYPNKSINDIVVFEPPTDACKFVLLELPASAFGGEGMLRIKIHRSMWDETLISRQRAEEEQKAAEAKRLADEKKLQDRKEAEASHQVETPITEVQIKYLNAFPGRYVGKKVRTSGWANWISTQGGKRNIFHLNDVRGEIVDNIMRGVKNQVVIVQTDGDFPDTLISERVEVVGVFCLDSLRLSSEEEEIRKRAGVPTTTLKQPFIKHAQLVVDGQPVALKTSEETPLPSASKQVEPSPPSVEKARWHTWTSADGSHTIEAKFVKTVFNAVYLEKKDGTTIQVQREKLIDDDWTWIKNKSWNSSSE